MMTRLKVYHNLNLFHYDVGHSQIVPPTRPVATVTVTDDLPLLERLNLAYNQTQHSDMSWYNRPGVLAHLRSTSVGDLIDDGEGNLYVVEAVGFQPYRPKAITPAHRLAAAHKQLQTAVANGDRQRLLQEAGEALAAIEYVLAADGYPVSESPIMWEKAQVGDLVRSASGEQFRVIARRLRPKWRARRLLAHVPNAQIWIDSPRTWAVVTSCKKGRSS
jgi:hypothetical protein